MVADSVDPFDFPCDFPLKVMGARRDGFADAIAALVQRHAPDFDAATITMRASRNGAWLSLTCTFRAESRRQLDELYREVSAHPWVKIVL